MADDTSLAFGLPIERAKATASGSDPLDRISVRDYVRDVEIGAFQSERGVTQRLRFNVVLEVARSAGSANDDVDQIISYDTITDAIEEELTRERLNLLETLAENVASRCLEDRRAVRVFVRIEKLDRIPGALGVEIMRRRIDPDSNVVVPVEEPRQVTQKQVRPVIIFLPNELVTSSRLPEWLDCIEALPQPPIIALGPVETDLEPVDHVVQRRIGLLAVEQNAWILASRDDRCVVVSTRTELEWAAGNGSMSVWAPSKLVLDAVHRPKIDARKPRQLANWFAGEIGAVGVIEVGEARDTTQDRHPVEFVPIDAPKKLADISFDDR